jgi:hypothetical protein
MTTILIAALSFVVGAITGGFVLPAYQRQRIERRRPLIAPVVPVTVAAVLGRLHEPLNLGHGKIFPRPQLVVWWANRN